MRAELIYREKYVYADGAIREMVLWKVPRRTANFPEAIKYRLYYGLDDGTCVVRFDNEKGKGHHKHLGKREGPYVFKDVESLVADFLKDIEIARGTHDGKTD
jgi:hypothetical protein